MSRLSLTKTGGATGLAIAPEGDVATSLERRVLCRRPALAIPRSCLLVVCGDEGERSFWGKGKRMKRESAMASREMASRCRSKAPLARVIFGGHRCPGCAHAPMRLCVLPAFGAWPPNVDSVPLERATQRRWWCVLESLKLPCRTSRRASAEHSPWR